MACFDDFDTPQRRSRAVAKEMIRRGGFHVYGPNDQEMEKRVTDEVNAAMALLREYHEWLTRGC